MKRKIVSMFLCMLLIGTILPPVAMAIEINTEKNNNSPPDAPTLSAPDTVSKNRKFLVKATSTDPDGDQIYYRFKVGEDDTPCSWRGPYYSGYQFRLNVRIIGYTGDLIVSFQAKDSHDAESEWSYVQVSYTKSRNLINSELLLRFFEKFMNLFPILKNLK